MSSFPNAPDSEFVKGAKQHPHIGLGLKENLILLTELLNGWIGSGINDAKTDIIQYINNGVVSGYAVILVDSEAGTTTVKYFDANLAEQVGAPAGDPSPRHQDYEYEWFETSLVDPLTEELYTRIDCIPFLNGVAQATKAYWRLPDFSVVDVAPAPALVERAAEIRTRLSESTVNIDDSAAIAIPPGEIPATANLCEIFPSIDIAWDINQDPVVSATTAGIPNNANHKIEIENRDDILAWKAISLAVGGSGRLRIFFYDDPNPRNT